MAIPELVGDDIALADLLICVSLSHTALLNKLTP